jgi:hypothetical protein
MFMGTSAGSAGGPSRGAVAACLLAGAYLQNLRDNNPLVTIETPDWHCTGSCRRPEPGLTLSVVFDPSISALKKRGAKMSTIERATSLDRVCRCTPLRYEGHFLGPTRCLTGLAGRGSRWRSLMGCRKSAPRGTPAGCESPWIVHPNRPQSATKATRSAS